MCTSKNNTSIYKHDGRSWTGATPTGGEDENELLFQPEKHTGTGADEGQRGGGACVRRPTGTRSIDDALKVNGHSQPERMKMV
jgi:hypothetical protein